MNSVAKVVWLLLLVLVGCLVYALTEGNIDASGPTLFGSPWGVMTLVDLYAGFALFSIFILIQEKQRKTAIAWIGALLVLGNIVACVYLLLKLKQKSFSLPDRHRLAPRKKAL